MKNRLFSILFLFVSLHLFSEGRVKNLDFIVLLDKSLSMENKIGDVKQFFKSQLLEKSVIPGDSITIIQFYGKAEVLIQKEVSSSQDILEIGAILDKVQADGRYTDIGNAIDFTIRTVPAEADQERRRHFILLTDGRQEAPPGSPYASSDFTVSHDSLKSAKTIAREQWKVQILGIGTDSQAESLAEELSGTSQIWKDAQSLLLDREWDAEEELLMLSPPRLTFENGKAYLELDLDTQAVGSSRSFAIKQITASSFAFPEARPLLAQPVAFAIEKPRMKVSIALDPTISPVTLEASTFRMHFGGSLPLTPGQFRSTSGWFFLQEDSWFLPACTLASLLLLFIISLIFLRSSPRYQSLKRKTVELYRTFDIPKNE